MIQTNSEDRAKLRLLLVGAVLSYLVYRLTEIGWPDVLSALPTNPLFYIITPMIFMVLPLTERVVYRRYAAERDTCL